MITPDGTDGERQRTGIARNLAIGLSALVVVAGLFVVSSLTSPDRITTVAPTSTSTTTPEHIEPPVDAEHFSVSQIATGVPLDWELSMAIDDHYPLALTERDGLLYLFAGETPSNDLGTRGLTVWRSANGTGWEAIGEVIPADYRISAIRATAQGLVAAGSRLGDNTLMLWESRDGMGWVASEIATADSPYFVHVASALAGGDETLLVASKPRYDRESLLEDRLGEIGIDVELSMLSWNLRWTGEEGHRLYVRGPLGIPILTQDIDSLDLSDDERRNLLAELYDPLGIDVWARDATGGWTATEIGDIRGIDSIVTTPAGRFVAYGPGASGRVTKVSQDGVEWLSSDPSASPWETQTWARGLVGGIDSPDLVISEDGESWQAAGLSTRLPDGIGWAGVSLGAGEGGAAMFITGARPLLSLPDQDTPVLTAADGSVFRVDQVSDALLISSEDGRRRWAMEPDDPRLSRAVHLEFPARALTLRDPDSGEDVATFPLAELERAQREHLLATPLYETWAVLAFTGDGREWTIQDMARDIGEDAMVALLEVTDERVVAVVRDGLAGAATASPGFEVWSASVP